MAEDTLAEHREVWARKRCLRLIYRSLHQRMARACRPGRTLELGGGIGSFKDYLPDVVTTDIQAAPWLDLVADAQDLPFADGSFDNIVLMDVLHHLPHPSRFLAEAERVLVPGGRLVLMEPAITPLSWPFYHYIHQESVRLGVDPLGAAAQCSTDPYDANQAVPTLLFGRHLARCRERFPALRMVEKRFLSILAYPLSGGFKRWTLLPGRVADLVLALDDVLSPLLGRWLGFRMLVVLERA
jgi:SAM-dependent methyltransferase